MKTKHWLSSTAGALALTVLAMPTEAAAVSGIAGDLRTAVVDQSSREQAVHYRRGCWTYRGHWRCHRRSAYYYDPYYYSYGPSVGLFFGGHHGHGFRGHGFHGHGFGHGHGHGHGHR